jgi:type IV pilus assembly protein PilC
VELLQVIITLVLVAVLVAIVLRWICEAWLGKVRWAPFRNWLLTRTVRLHQASLTRAVVSHLSAITNLNLPLAAALTTAGRAERGRLGYVLRQMATLSAQGLPLSAAMQKANPACPPVVASVIAAGEQAGQLPQALADAEAMLNEQVSAETPAAQLGGRYWPYPAIVLGFTAVVLASLMVMVVPKFQEIFVDFDAELPAVTLSLINAVNRVTGGHDFLLAIGAVVLLLVATTVVSVAFRRPGEAEDPVIRDAFAWVPGPARTITFGKGMSVTVRVIRMALTAGMTLPAAAELAGSVRVNRYLRRRWERFARLLRTGAPASEAAKQAGLGSVFVWACRNLERGAADVRETLEHAADYHRAIANRWWRALSRTSWPAITCALGCIVGYVVLAFFLPLIALINAVSATMP